MGRVRTRAGNGQSQQADPAHEHGADDHELSNDGQVGSGAQRQAHRPEGREGLEDDREDVHLVPGEPALGDGEKQYAAEQEKQGLDDVHYGQKDPRAGDLAFEHRDLPT